MRHCPFTDSRAKNWRGPPRRGPCTARWRPAWRVPASVTMTLARLSWPESRPGCWNTLGVLARIVTCAPGRHRPAGAGGEVLPRGRVVMRETGAGQQKAADDLLGVPAGLGTFDDQPATSRAAAAGRRRDRGRPDRAGRGDGRTAGGQQRGQDRAEQQCEPDAGHAGIRPVRAVSHRRHASPGSRHRRPGAHRLGLPRSGARCRGQLPPGSRGLSGQVPVTGRRARRHRPGARRRAATRQPPHQPGRARPRRRRTGRTRCSTTAATSASSGPRGSGELASSWPSVRGRVSRNTDPSRALPRPAASPRAAGHPPARWPGRGRCRRWCARGPGRRARTGRRPGALRPARNPRRGRGPRPPPRPGPWPTVTTTSRPSPCSTALSSRLRRIRSTRRRSTSATHGLGWQPEVDPGAPAGGQLLGIGRRPPHQVADIRRLGVQGRHVGVVAADLQQVREQRLEPLELALQQFRAAPGGRIEMVLGLEQDVRRRS